MGFWSKYVKPSLGLIGGVFGGPLGAVAGGLIGGSGSSGASSGTPQQTGGVNSTPTPYTEIPSPWKGQGGQPALGGQYTDYLRNALSGQQGLPQGYMQQQMQEGQTSISGQAQQSRARLMRTLGERGMLRSGVLSSGLADIERGKAQAQGALSGSLTRADMDYRMQNQQQAGSLISSLIAMREAGLAGSANYQNSLLSLQQQAQQAKDNNDEALYSSIMEGAMSLYGFVNPPEQYNYAPGAATNYGASSGSSAGSYGGTTGGYSFQDYKPIGLRGAL